MRCGLTRGNEGQGGTSIDNAGSVEDGLAVEGDGLIDTDVLACWELLGDRALHHSVSVNLVSSRECGKQRT